METLRTGRALRSPGVRMKVVRLSKSKALKGDHSRSYQLVTPESAGTRNFMITVVDVLPKGSTPAHHHALSESMYFILQGRGEILGDNKARVGPGMAVYFPAGSIHGIRNTGGVKLRYVSCHAPPYDIERLYKSWEGELLVTGG